MAPFLIKKKKGRYSLKIYSYEMTLQRFEDGKRHLKKEMVEIQKKSRPTLPIMQIKIFFYILAITLVSLMLLLLPETMVKKKKMTRVI